MFFFTRPKTPLKDLIPQGYVDIHSHLLFGIDDGAQTFEDTLFLTRSMADMGVAEFITTPHTLHQVWDNTRESIENKGSETKSLLEQNNIIVPFRPASEYLIDDHFKKQFESEDLLVLKNDHVLVEMSYLNPPIQLYSILFDLQMAGYRPVLAHPERYLFYHNNFAEYKKLKKAGCLFQLNLLSAVGYYGEAVLKSAKMLLSEGMIDYAGSDVHHRRHIDAFSNKVKLKDLMPLKEALENNAFFKS